MVMFCLFILRLRVYFVLKNLVIEMLKKKDWFCLINIFRNLFWLIEDWF